MAKFNFKLQSLLNVKEQIENEVKNELGLVTKKLNIEKELLNKKINEKKMYFDDFKHESLGITNIEQIIIQNEYLERLNKRINKQKEIVIQCEKSVNQVRNKLIKASQEKEVLIKLKEKEFEEFKYNIQSEEQKKYDEYSSYKSSQN